MNDAIRGTINAQLHNRHMTRSDLARAIDRTPQEVTRALNGSRDGARGGVPSIWASMLDALGLALVAVPSEQNVDGAALLARLGGPASTADLGTRVDEALKLLTDLRASLPSEAQAEAGSAAAAADTSGGPSSTT